MNDQMSIEELLAAFADIMAHRDALAATKAEMEDVILAPVKVELMALEEEFAPGFEELDRQATEIKARVEGMVAERGASVKAAGWTVVYRDGSVRWDDKKLLDYASKHPEIMGWRSRGKSSASLQVSRGGRGGNFGDA